jgi:hypothetical protein
MYLRSFVLEFVVSLTIDIYDTYLLTPRESSVFCGPSTVDVFLDFASGNIDGLGSTKHTVSLGLSK